MKLRTIWMCFLLIPVLLSAKDTFAFHASSTIDSLFNLIGQYDKGMGSVSVYKNGQKIYGRYYGYSSLEDSVQIDASTLFRIGSVSKTFTATLIFKLIEEGRLKLSDPLSKWFPLFGNARTITLQHLLTHQSGLYNFTNDAAYLSWNTGEHTREALLAKLIRYPNVFMPGTTTEYSNTNYVLLTWIAEMASGESYAHLLKRMVTDPLQLKQTFSSQPSGVVVASSYTRFKEWKKESATHESIPLGAGALLSTPDDLNLFIQGLFSGKIIGESSLKKMTTITPETMMGMGFLKAPFYERSAFGHTGGIDGFQSRLFYFPDDSVSVAITSNAVVYPLNDIMIAILSKLFGVPYLLPVFKEEVMLTEAELAKFTGTYSGPGLPIKLTVFIRDGILNAQGTGQPEFPLTSTAPTVFTFEKGGIVLEFLPAKKQLVLKQMGARFVMNKED